MDTYSMQVSVVNFLQSWGTTRMVKYSEHEQVSKTEW